jgi:hypothetical protein
VLLSLFNRRNRLTDVIVEYVIVSRDTMYSILVLVVGIVSLGLALLVIAKSNKPSYPLGY